MSVERECRGFTPDDTPLGLIATLRDLQSFATQEEWFVAKAKYDDVGELAKDADEMTCKGGNTLHYLYGVFGDGNRFTAVTGNGPTSEANAMYICALVKSAPQLFDLIERLILKE